MPMDNIISRYVLGKLRTYLLVNNSLHRRGEGKEHRSSRRFQKIYVTAHA